MNQARTTYQSDYTPVDWLQNNFISDRNEFCSSENVDECLKYISQEFCALGYPSIYSNSSDCPFAVNCDIITFLNTTFELLKCNHEHIQTKEDLESRNQRLYSDLNVISKKNAQLKSTLEQTERKLACSSEKERQLKGKNEQLSQLLKSEREETKKLTSQLRQQKVAYQHEIRKHENNINHIKTKLNQLLSDKTPNKKLANISISHTLPRTTGQRGKWKSGTAATTAVEDMYNSVISNYEIRCKNMNEELDSFRRCLQSVLLQVLEIVSTSLSDVDGDACSMTSKEFVHNEIKRECRDVQNFEDKFKYLLSVWHESETKKVLGTNKNLKEEIAFLKSKIAEYEKILEVNKESSQIDGSELDMNKSGVQKKEATVESLDEDTIKKEKIKLEEERLVLYKLRERIEKEKVEIAAEKLAVLRLAMQQKTATSPWHQSPNTLPSISVITSRNGTSRMSSMNEFKSFSSPDQIGQLHSSSWESSGETKNEVFYSKSDSVLLPGKRSTTESPAFSPLAASMNISNSDLPSWAVKKSDVLITDEVQNTIIEANQNTSVGEIDLPSEPSSEELSLMRLKAAMHDIESRKANML